MRKYYGSYGALPTLAAIVCMVCFAVWSLGLKPVTAAQDDPVYEVRMAVDPTVLPPVMPPEAPLDEESVTVTPLSEKQQAEETNTDVSVVVVDETTSTPKATEVEVVPTAQPEAKPAPKAAPVSKPAPKAKLSDKGEVKKITVSSVKDWFVVTVFCDRPVGDTSYMNLNNPRRLVVDMRQPWIHNAKNVIRPSTGVVKHVVTGNHPDRFRMVVYFHKPPKGRLSPSIKRIGNKLVVKVQMP